MPQRHEVLHGTVHGIPVHGPWFEGLGDEGHIVVFFDDPPTDKTEYGTVYLRSLGFHARMRIEKYDGGWIHERGNYPLDKRSEDGSEVSTEASVDQEIHAPAVLPVPIRDGQEEV
jgi:hypothetical protein